MKTCSKCGRNLPKNMFSKDKNKRDGLNSWCRDCFFEYSKKKRPNAKQHGIRKQIPNGNELRILYENDGRSIEDIAQTYGVSYFAIYKRLKRAGTLFRTPVESRRISEKAGRIEPQKGKKHSPEQREKNLISLEKARLALAKTRTHRTISSQGYIKIYTENGKYRFEHDVIMEKIMGRPLSDNECVHHINHIKDDNRPENLLVIDKRNHAIMHQRELIENKKHHIAKLTRQKVLQIRQSKESYKILADRFGVSKSAICSIKRGRTWKDI